MLLSGQGTDVRQASQIALSTYLALESIKSFGDGGLWTSYIDAVEPYAEAFFAHRIELTMDSTKDPLGARSLSQSQLTVLIVHLLCMMMRLLG